MKTISFAPPKVTLLAPEVPVPAQAVPLSSFCRHEARKLKLTADSVLQRINAGWYVGMELVKKNARVAWVLRPGKSRKAIPHKQANRPKSYQKRLPIDPENYNPNAKYIAWMTADNCGGMTPRYSGNG